MRETLAGGAKLLTHTSVEKKESIGRISYDQLLDRPYPNSMGRFHKPVKYSDIIDAIDNGLERHNIQPVQSEYILARGGKLLMGAIEIKGQHGIHLPGDLTNQTLLCFMASEAQLTAMKLRGGTNISMCDNLMMSGGSVLVAHKFTTKAQILNRIWHGFKEWIKAKELYEAAIHRLNNNWLNEEKASKQILEVAAGNPRKNLTGVVPFKYAKEAWNQWVNPKGDDTRPRTEWGLHNAWTRALREAPTQSKIQSSIAVSAYYGV